MSRIAAWACWRHQCVPVGIVVSTPLPPRAVANLQPGTPTSATDRALNPGLSAASGSTSVSWSPWDQGSSGVGSTFYKQLQAAACDGFACLGSSSSSVCLAAGSSTVLPPSLASPAAAAACLPLSSLSSPFPGLVGPGGGLALGFGPMVPVAAHRSAASLDAEQEMQQLMADITSMATHEC